MKTYTIIEVKPAIQTWTYQVTANSSEEAIAILVEQGTNHPQVSEIDFTTETDYTRDDSKFYVQSVKFNP